MGIRIVIAGIPVFLRTEDFNFAKLLKKRCQYFCSSSGRVDSAIEIEIEFLKKYCRVHSATTPKILVFYNKLEILHSNFHSEIDLRTNLGKLETDRNIFSLDSFLRILYSFLLLKNNGFLIHGTGILKRGEGYIFTGPTGSGKTTIARLSPLNSILSDEVVAVRNGIVYSTPFWGEFQQGRGNLKGKTKELFFLKHSRKFYIEKLSLAEGIKNLLRNALFFSKESECANRLIKICADLIKKIPCYNLYFYPTKLFWRKLSVLIRD